MRAVLKNIALKCFLLFMALQILNQSIDAIDFQPLVFTSNFGNFNDINSAAEYVSEIILNHKDLFPEFEKNGTHKQSQSFKHINVKIAEPQMPLVLTNSFTLVPSFKFPLDERHTFLFSKEITPPPPKA